MIYPSRSATLMSSTFLALACAACSSDGGDSGSSESTGGGGLAAGTGGWSPLGGVAANPGSGAARNLGGTGGSPGAGGGTPGSGATLATGGNANPNGGFGAGGFRTNTGGSNTGGFLAATGGFDPLGGSSSTGAAGNATGGLATGGFANPTGGASTGGWVSSTGGSTGGDRATGGAWGEATGGSGEGDATGGMGSENTDSCSFSVDSETSSAMPTVGIVEWSTSLANLTSASIEFSLQGSGTSLEAPVDLDETSGQGYRTLLLGMKQQRTYSFHITASAGNTTCTSEEYTISTGALANAPQVSQQLTNAAASVGGFIVTSVGMGGMGGGGFPGGGTTGGGSSVFIIDADGDVVWATSGPSSASRAHMSYDGQAMWMLALNVGNSGGEMRWLSMDGLDGQNNVSGLSAAHHDFCVVDDNSVAALVWSSNGKDPPSDLIERSEDGAMRTVIRDSAAYQSNSYHSNALHYYPWDDSYIIGDRNPNLYVNVTRQGQVVWQFGGSCNNAPAPACAAGSWQVNHGLDWDEDGNFVFFNNGSGMGASTVYQYKLSVSGNSLTATQQWSIQSNASSNVLGDVQHLPSGGVLVTYSTSGSIVEYDSQRNAVRTLSSSSFGYADWRPTLYGPPARL